MRVSCNEELIIYVCAILNFPSLSLFLPLGRVHRSWSQPTHRLLT